MANNITLDKPTAHIAATPSVWVPPSNDAINLGMSVSDGRLRSIGVETDGLEKPFALVPKNGEWKRYDLQYGGSFSNRGSSDVRDTYNLRLDLNTESLNLPEVQRLGVAFGLDVAGAFGANPTTVWLQGFEDNYKP